jgi:hypothetical protein
LFRKYFKNQRVDTLTEFFDTLCSNPDPQLIVILSLSLYFRRDQNSLYKAITGYPLKEDQDIPSQLIGFICPILSEGSSGY